VNFSRNAPTGTTTLSEKSRGVCRQVQLPENRQLPQAQPEACGENQTRRAESDSGKPAGASEGQPLTPMKLDPDFRMGGLAATPPGILGTIERFQSEQSWTV
jgi:hypothetical protein